MAKKSQSPKPKSVGTPAITGAPVRPKAPAAPRRPIAIPPALLWVAGAAGILVMGLALFRYGQYLNRDAINAPFGDDYRSTLNFLVDYLRPNATISDKLSGIFSQHNEHRIAFHKLVVLADYFRLGIVDFRNQTLFANTAILLIAGLVFAAFGEKESVPVRLLVFAPVVLVLFQPSYWETQIWAMAALSNLYVVAFALGSLFVLGRSKLTVGAFAGSSLLALAATFTLGSGMLVFVAGAAWLLLTKQWRWLLAWVVVMGIAVVVYFHGYAKPSDSPDVAATLLKTPGLALDYLLNLLGSFTAISPAKPTLVGWLLLVSLAGLLGDAVVRYARTGQTPSRNLLFLVFMYLTAASLTAGRAGFGAMQAYSPRYGLIPVLIIGLTYLLLVDRLPWRGLRLGTGGVVCLLAYWLNTESYRVNLLQAEDRVGQLRYNAALYADNRQNRLLLPPNDTKDANPTFYDKAEARKLYALNVFTFDQIRPQLQRIDAGSLVSSGDILADVKPYDTGKYIVVYNAWAFLRDQLADKSTTSVIVQSPTAAYEIATEPRIRFDIANQYQQPSLRWAGFATIIRKADLPKGNYQLGVRIRNGKANAYAPAGVTFAVN